MPRFFQYITAPAGRLLLSAIFIASGANKISDWAGTADRMRGEGMVFVPLFLFGAILFELGGGLSILVGWKARLGALALIVFLVPVTLIFHDFWQYEGSERMMQMIQFMKNLAVMGGLLIVLTHGAGPASVDDCLCKRRRRDQTES